MIEDKDCKDMKYFYLINLFSFWAVNLGFIRSRWNGRRNSTVSSRNNLVEIFVISLISHWGILNLPFQAQLDIRFIISAHHSGWQTKLWEIKEINFIVGWSPFDVWSEGWWGHYLGVTEEAGGDCWSSLSHSQLRTDWLRPTDEQAAPEKSQHHQGDVKCMIPSSPPPHHTTPHHHLPPSQTINNDTNAHIARYYRYYKKFYLASR